MQVRFQVDADLDGRVLRGLRRVAPGVDIRTAADAEIARLDDSEVLQIAAESGRILVSQDRRTMPFHFKRYVAGAESPGVILLRAGIPIATAIEELSLIWSASVAEEWVNRLVWSRFNGRAPLAHPPIVG
jgi:predicted nuclease of predicted toxin-antitoxin system